MDFKSTSLRAISGSVYVLIIILACWAGEIGITILASVFSILGIMEFRKMRFGNPSNHLFLPVYNAVGGVLLTLSFLIYPFFFWILWLIGRLVFTIYSKHGHPEKEFAVDMAAQMYIGLPMAMLAGLGYFCQELCNTCMPILSIFILIWVNDTGAFLFGSTLGKHKLFPRVSPKKSWEGFWGGCITTIAIGILIGATGTPLSAEYLGDKVLFWGMTGLIVSIA
ncbi:MAG: phosphatidate cytidylyltransferase, partial [Muribaculaceae bacterium]|nr:phosphatidate cytidylyltransferase [Muribaculaceae bacterium]